MTGGVDFLVYGAFVEDMCRALEAWGLMMAGRVAPPGLAFSPVNKGYFQDLGSMADILNLATITVQCLWSMPFEHLSTAARRIRAFILLAVSVGSQIQTSITGMQFFCFFNGSLFGFSSRARFYFLQKILQFQSPPLSGRKWAGDERGCLVGKKGIQRG